MNAKTYDLPERNAHGTTEVGAYWNISGQTVRKLAESGRIPAVRLGKCWRIPDEVARALPDYLNGKAAA